MEGASCITCVTPSPGVTGRRDGARGYLVTSAVLFASSGPPPFPPDARGGPGSTTGGVAMSDLDAWFRAVRHARTVERQRTRLDDAVRARDQVNAYPVSEFMSPDHLVAVGEAVRDEAYFYVIACGRLAASVDAASDFFPGVFDQADLDLMEVLRNFWEHEDDYPLLASPHPTRSRRKTLDFLAEYGLSPAMRSVVQRSKETQSVVISDRLDIDLWRAKAQAVADTEPPTSGSPAQAGA